jgi:glycosyltransferase involved in cell wall biosynthesis
MKILLVGNYELGDGKSMPRFGEMLRRELTARGHQVRLLRPKGLLGNVKMKETASKWLSYVDQYVFFPIRLWVVSAGSWDAIHICDHSNAVYRPWVLRLKPSITCHDLLAIQGAEGRFAEHRTSFTGRLLQGWIKRNLLKIERVICVSGKTAEDLREMGSRAEIVVIPNPLHGKFSPSDRVDIVKMKAQVGLRMDEQYALQLGGNLWYKNRLGVVRIFAELLKRKEFAQLRLVMAGHPLTEALRDEIRRLNLDEKVIEVRDPDDRIVRALYTNAEMLLFPSLYEGFGWPIVEAQSCGCVVVTSDREPMREVGGGAAILVDPVALEKAATDIAEAWPSRDAMRLRGFENVERFGTREILEQYESFMNGRSE